MVSKPHGYITIVDIGILRLKVMVLNASNGKLALAAVKDLSNITDRDNREKFVVNALKEILRDYISKAKAAILCMSEEHFLIKRIEMPSIPVDEITAALKWRIKDLVSFDIEKACIDFDLVKETATKTGDKTAKLMDLIAVVIPKETVDSKVKILKKAGIETILSANIDSFGLSNIVSLLPEGKKGNSCAVLNVDHSVSAINMYKDGKLAFVRNIPIGLDHIREAIKAPIMSDAGEIDLSDEEMHTLRNMGIPENKDTLLSGKLEGRHILAQLRPVLQNLSGEISRSLDYYNSQLEGGAISKLYIIGESYRFKNLDRYFKESLNKDTEYLGTSPVLFDTLVENKNALKQEDMPQIIPLLGVGRGGNIGKVNLLPNEYKIEKAVRIENISVRMVGFVVFSVLIVLHGFSSIKIKDYTKSLESTKREMKSLYSVRALYEQVSQKEKYIDIVWGLERPTTLLMKELSGIIPEHIVLTNLFIDQKKNLITLKGLVSTESGVGEVFLADLIKSMDKSDYFDNANLSSSQKGATEQGQVTIFVINCKILK